MTQTKEQEKHTPGECVACKEVSHAVNILLLCPVHAAAHDLLAALKALLAMYETPDDLTEDEKGYVLEDVQQAIAKAEGR